MPQPCKHSASNSPPPTAGQQTGPSRLPSVGNNGGVSVGGSPQPKPLLPNRQPLRNQPGGQSGTQETQSSASQPHSPPPTQKHQFSTSPSGVRIRNIAGGCGSTMGRVGTSAATNSSSCSTNCGSGVAGSVGSTSKTHQQSMQRDAASGMSQSMSADQALPSPRKASLSPKPHQPTSTLASGCNSSGDRFASVSPPGRAVLAVTGTAPSATSPTRATASPVSSVQRGSSATLSQQSSPRPNVAAQGLATAPSRNRQPSSVMTSSIGKAFGSTAAPPPRVGGVVSGGPLAFNPSQRVPLSSVGGGANGTAPLSQRLPLQRAAISGDDAMTAVNRRTSSESHPCGQDSTLRLGGNRLFNPAVEGSPRHAVLRGHSSSAGCGGCLTGSGAFLGRGRSSSPGDATAPTAAVVRRS
eukprot:TRINITY_DN1262_c0_g2_i1.p1 TRINITY_DN1262_c0_g2~~TRINITY_DN1262_c0_g2_i1.p1  ORF type:complete len:437 (+),score=65.83 TRINITY_DN1262_c0_g2_i1:80-1312(+)